MFGSLDTYEALSFGTNWGLIEVESEVPTRMTIVMEALMLKLSVAA